MKKWPDVFGANEDQVQSTLQPKMRQSRPVLVEGYETMVMARLLHEGTDVNKIVADWPSLLQRALKSIGASREELNQYLEDYRYSTPCCVPQVC